MEIKLVIFDLDGTLLDSLEDIAEGVNYALHQTGHPSHPIPSYKLFVGNGIAKLFERALPEGISGDDKIASMRKHFTDWYQNHMTDATRPFAGLPELLTELHQKGIKLAVASNKYHEATVQLVAHYFPTLPFVAVFGHRKGFPTKPNPAIVHEILELSGIAASQTIYVGDSGVDMQTAINSNTIACGVSWGFKPRSELESFHPTFLVDTPAELRKVLITQLHVSGKSSN
jgi:phosphoglycolate phosphatase